MVKIQTHGGPGGKTGISLPIAPKLKKLMKAPPKHTGHARRQQPKVDLGKIFETVSRHVGKSIRDLGGSDGPFGGHFPHTPRGGAYGFFGNPCDHGGPSIPSDGVSIKNGRRDLMGAVGFRQWDPTRGWRGLPPVFGSLAGLIRDRGL